MNPELYQFVKSLYLQENINNNNNFEDDNNNNDDEKEEDMIIKPYIWNNIDNTLLMFLFGTLDDHSPISLMRGQRDLLRVIFMLTCEEYWEEHIIKMKDSYHVHAHNSFATFKNTPKPNKHIQINGLPKLLPKLGAGDYKQTDPQFFGGVPAATIAENVDFPKPLKINYNDDKKSTSSSSQQQFFVKDITDENIGHLYVNMLPFNLCDKNTLPDCLMQYWDIIEICTKKIRQTKKECAYLTIDERPVTSGHSQRRAGVHTESPSILPIFKIGEENNNNNNNNYRVEYLAKEKNGSWVPGAEHHWGSGMLMRRDQIIGGIYMVSNVDNSTAVWNHYINDMHGEVIGPYGDLEHVRSLLKKPSKLLKKGELVWMTDKTPHESLPLKHNEKRQYFRLVCGDVSAWFSNHSTKNPKFNVEDHVRIVDGNKFKLNVGRFSKRWISGTNKELERLRGEKELYSTLQEYGLCHLAERWIVNGVNNINKLYFVLLRNFSSGKDGLLMKHRTFELYNPLRTSSRMNGTDPYKTLVNTSGFRYFERDQLHRLMEVLGEKYEHQKAVLQKIKNEVSQQIKDDKAILKMGKLKLKE